MIANDWEFGVRDTKLDTMPETPGRKTGDTLSGRYPRL
jgi:hypothetical protein